MPFTINQIMERVGSREPQRIIEYIREAFGQMALNRGGSPQVAKQDIIEDRLLYTLPSQAMCVNRVSVLYEDLSSELMEDADRTFTGITNWTNTDFDSFGTGTDLSVGGTSTQSCYLDDTDIIEENKKYRLEYDAAITSGTFDLYAKTDDTKLGRFETGTSKVMEFIAPADDELKITAVSSGTADFDNFSLIVMEKDKYKPAKRIIGDLSQTYFDEET